MKDRATILIDKCQARRRYFQNPLKRERNYISAMVWVGVCLLCLAVLFNWWLS